jgi:hypothetical protein
MVMSETYTELYRQEVVAVGVTPAEPVAADGVFVTLPALAGVSVTPAAALCGVSVGTTSATDWVAGSLTSLAKGTLQASTASIVTSPMMASLLSINFLSFIVSSQFQIKMIHRLCFRFAFSATILRRSSNDFCISHSSQLDLYWWRITILSIQSHHTLSACSRS